jgi:hypothetical protein
MGLSPDENWFRSPGFTPLFLRLRFQIRRERASRGRLKIEREESPRGHVPSNGKTHAAPHHPTHNLVGNGTRILQLRLYASKTEFYFPGNRNI